MTYKDFYKKYLPKDIARKAINNSEDLMLEGEVEKEDWNDVQSPLIRGFVWGSTKEGHDFWRPYHYKLIHPDMENTRVKHFKKKNSLARIFNYLFK